MSAAPRRRTSVVAVGRHVLSVVAGVATFALVARHQGAAALGAWALLGSLATLLGLSDAGLTVALQRAAVADDRARTHHTLRFAMLAVSVFGPLGAVAAWLVSSAPPGTSPALARDLSHATLIVLVAGVINAAAGPLRGLALVRGRVAEVATARAAAIVSQLVVLFGAYPLARSLCVPASALALAAVVETGLLARLARAIEPNLSLRPGWPRDRALRDRCIRDASASLAINAVVTAALRADVIVLARVSPLEVVAAYGVASRAVDQLFTLAKQVSAAFLSRLGDANRRAANVRDATMLLGGALAASMTALIFFGLPLLGVWAGPAGSSPAAATALALLGAAAVIAGMYEPASSALTLGGASAWAGAGPEVVGCALNVIITVALSRYGVWAVATATVIGNATAATLAWTRLRPMLSWTRADVAMTLAPALLAALTSLLVGAPLSTAMAPSVLTSLVCGPIVALAGMAAAWWGARRLTCTSGWASLRTDSRAASSATRATSASA